jgi:hypothetical protein
MFGVLAGQLVDQDIAFCKRQGRRFARNIGCDKKYAIAICDSAQARHYADCNSVVAQVLPELFCSRVVSGRPPSPLFAPCSSGRPRPPSFGDADDLRLFLRSSAKLTSLFQPCSSRRPLSPLLPSCSSGRPADVFLGGRPEALSVAFAIGKAAAREERPRSVRRSFFVVIPSRRRGIPPRLSLSEIPNTHGHKCGLRSKQTATAVIPSVARDLLLLPQAISAGALVFPVVIPTESAFRTTRNPSAHSLSANFQSEIFGVPKNGAASTAPPFFLCLTRNDLRNTMPTRRS